MEHFIKLAFKNVFRQKKRSFTLGVNYAVVAFILVLLLAFSRGATVNISDSLVASSAGHITITGRFAKDGKIYGGIERTGDIVAGVKKTFGNDASTIVRYAVKSTVYYGGLSKRLSFTGIDSESDTRLGEQAQFSAGSWADFAKDPNGVAMPRAEAEYFGLKIGDEIILSTRTRFGAFNTGILVVRGIYESTNYFAKSAVLAHFDYLRDVDLSDKDAASSIYVYLPSTANLSAKRKALAAELATQGFEVRVPTSDSEAIAAVSGASTKYEADKEGRDRTILTLSTLDEVLGIVRSVLAAVNGVGSFIAAVMLFVIAVSIFINLRMSVNERMQEIGTMRAMGVEASGVTALFVLESVALAIMFSGAGAVLAAVVALVVRLAFTFPSGGNLGIFLNGGHLVLIPDPLAMLGVVAVISLFAAFFSFFPARRGGLIPPVEALTKTF
jgi:ABC-type lipoprotein release transport system permease subunit